MTELRPHPSSVSLAAVCRSLGVPPVDGLVSGVSLDTQLVQAGDLFAALPGARTHGARFADAAVRAGAVAVLTDAAGAALLTDIAVPVLVVDDPRAQLGEVARAVYPGPRPRLIGVTGTNGKTTTTHCIAAAAAAAGIPTAIVGTLGVRFGALSSYSGRTTPEATSLHASLAACAEAGAAAAAMEVSSHALALHRVDGLGFEVAAFLNLTQDHLDFHGTMEAYFEAKAALFAPERAGHAVVCIDDGWGRALAERTSLPVTTVGRDAQWDAEDVRILDGGGTRFIARGPHGRTEVTMPLPGGFNVTNALVALACVDALGAGLDEAARGIASVSVPGRFERVPNERGIAAFVDYAHTPDAVERVLQVARASTRGRLIAVLGCGGDRDAAKRPHMARAAAAIADAVIVTDDNPRSENPAAIRRAMLEGVPGAVHVRELGDRAEAIAEAVALAGAGDCVMVLGKGHETGQEIAGVVHPFDDRDALRQALGAMA